MTKQEERKTAQYWSAETRNSVRTHKTVTCGSSKPVGSCTWNDFEQQHEFEAVSEVVLDVLDLSARLAQVGVTPRSEGLDRRRIISHRGHNCPVNISGKTGLKVLNMLVFISVGSIHIFHPLDPNRTRSSHSLRFPLSQQASYFQFRLKWNLIVCISLIAIVLLFVFLLLLLFLSNAQCQLL